MKIKYNTIYLILMYMLIINIPYFSHRLTYIIKLLLEIVLLILLILRRKKIDYTKFYHIIPFCLIIIFSTFLNVYFNTRLVTSIVFSVQIILFYVISNIIVAEEGFNNYIGSLLKLSLIVMIPVNLLIIFTFGKGIGVDGVLNLYLIGNKFSVCYLNMFTLALFYTYLNIYKKDYEDNKKIFILASILVLVICKLVDCNTGLIGCIILLSLIIAYKYFDKLRKYIFNRYTFIIIFILISIVFVNKNSIINLPFIQFLITKVLHRSGTLTGRVQMYEIAINTMLTKPLLGFGINCTIIYDILGYGNPQNGLLKLLLDFGIIGLVCFSVLSINSLKYKKINNYRVFGIFAFLYAMIVCCIVEININELFFLSMAVISSSNIKRIKESSSEAFMKKVCILSMQKVNNFGSLLQAYCLKNIVEELGCSVSFIDIKENEKDKNLLIDSKTFTNEHHKKPFLKRFDKYFFNRMKLRLLNKEQNYIFNNFRTNELCINEYDNNKKYDICIIGSDEVFNCATESPWGFTSQLFGNINNAKKIITYGASCGSTDFDELNINVRKRIKHYFKKISSFSVRDKNTLNFVKSFGIKKVKSHLDPVIVYNLDKEIKNNSKVNLPKRYCIIYSYYNRFNNIDEINAIKEFCNLNNLELVTIGAPQFWVKKHLVLNPFEVLYAFKNANFVITDTFHGTIFSSKYSKKFATIIRNSNKNKLLDLIVRLEKKRHLCNNINEINNIYLIDNDIERTNEIIKRESEKTYKYISKSIS